MTLNNTVEGMRQKRRAEQKSIFTTTIQTSPYGHFGFPGVLNMMVIVEAIDADYSQSVHVSFWPFVSASAYCSGASAVANGTFKKGVAPVSKIITLTCSKDGKLSFRY